MSVNPHLKSLLFVLGGIVVFAVLWPREASSPAEREALAQGRVVVTYWDRHSGHEHASRRLLIDEFNNSQDDVDVRALPVGYDTSMEKLLTAVAGGTPPDLIGMDGTIMSQLVTQGCFTPLDDFIATSAAVKAEDFFPFCWESMVMDGQVWGIPTTTDTYCLLWNKNAFRKAGLDPERPPRTMAELEAYAEKLTIRDDTGLRQIGFLPWLPWDLTTMWGFLFGGRWYNEETGLIDCADDPNIIRMFAWQQSFALDPRGGGGSPYAIDPEQMMSFQQGFGAYMSANNPFYTGKVAMTAEGEWQVTFIPIYAPELDWGVAPLPTPEGAPPRAYGSAPVADCIPAGAPNPEAAWTFLEWFYARRPGGGTSPVSDYNHAIHNIPCRVKEAEEERFTGDPKFRVFVDTLRERETVRPPITPLTQLLGNEMERQRERVAFYKTTPEEAARALQEKVNREFIRARRLVGRGGP